MFFSSGKYLLIPTKKNPKFALAVSSFLIAKNSFNLFNPFSLRAKILKKITFFFFVNLNLLSNKLFFFRNNDKSSFIYFLEKKLDCKLISSIYYSPTKDKVVMQLQNHNAEIIGYLKYPISEEGVSHIINEKSAIEILSDQNIVKNYIISDVFNEVPFLLLKNVEGNIGNPNKIHLDNLLLKFKKQGSFFLTSHPRIKDLKQKSLNFNFLNFSKMIENICKKSKKEYALVFEHGDLAPWNIFIKKSSCTPFDFEYFVKDGLEFLDLIKYYYSMGKLIKQKKGKNLISFVSRKVKIEEFEIIFKLFLIKEIMRNYSDNVPFKFELKLLGHFDKN